VPAKPVTADRRVCWPPCAAKAHHHIYQASCHLPQRHAGIAGERNSQLEDEWGERDDSKRGCVTRWSTKTLVTLRYIKIRARLYGSLSAQKIVCFLQ
jgi:hypothetical protein